QLPRVIRQMKKRIDTEATPDEQNTLWSTTFFLMGVRYPADVIAQALHGVHGMRESTTYMATLAGEARKILLRQGRKRFGPISNQNSAAIAAITDVDELEDLCERVLDVSTWEELLAAPQPNGGRKKKASGH